MTTTKQTELLPCPFCGGVKLKKHADDGQHWVECQKCFATGPAFSKRDESNPWNTRAQSAPEPVQSEAVAWKVIGVHPKHRHPHVCTEYTEKLAIGQAAHWRNRGCEVEVIPLYTASAKPDSELVALLREVSDEWRARQPACLLDRIDAKLAEVQK